MTIPRKVNYLAALAYKDKKVIEAWKVNYDKDAEVPTVSAVDAGYLDDTPLKIFIETALQSIIWKDDLYVTLHVDDENDNKIAMNVIVPRFSPEECSIPFSRYTTYPATNVKVLNELRCFKSQYVYYEGIFPTYKEILGEEPTAWIHPFNENFALVALEDLRRCLKLIVTTDTNWFKNTIYKTFHSESVYSKAVVGWRFSIKPKTYTNDFRLRVGVCQDADVRDDSGGAWNLAKWEIQISGDNTSNEIRYLADSGGFSQQIGTVSSADWIDFRIETDANDSPNTKVWVNGELKYSHNIAAYNQNHNTFFIYGAYDNGALQESYIFDPVFWSNDVQNDYMNEADEFSIYGIEGSIAKIIGTPAFMSDECRIITNQLAWGKFTDYSWGVLLKSQGKDLRLPQFNTGNELILANYHKNRLYLFKQIWSPLIPELKDRLAYLYQTTTANIEIIEYADMPMEYSVKVPNTPIDDFWANLNNLETYLNLINPTGTRLVSVDFV